MMKFSVSSTNARPASNILHYARKSHFKTWMLNTLHKEDMNICKSFKYRNAENINATSHLWHEILEELYEFTQHGYEYSVAAFLTSETKLHIMKSNYVQYTCIISMQWWNSGATSTTETKTCPLLERLLVIAKAVNVDANITYDCFYYYSPFLYQ
jgi:hypothetical protein